MLTVTDLFPKLLSLQHAPHSHSSALCLKSGLIVRAKSNPKPLLDPASTRNPPPSCRKTTSSPSSLSFSLCFSQPLGLVSTAWWLLPGAASASRVAAQAATALAHDVDLISRAIPATVARQSGSRAYPMGSTSRCISESFFQQRAALALHLISDGIRPQLHACCRLPPPQVSTENTIWWKQQLFWRQYKTHTQPAFV